MYYLYYHFFCYSHNNEGDIQIDEVLKNGNDSELIMQQYVSKLLSSGNLRFKDWWKPVFKAQNMKENEANIWVTSELPPVS